MAGTRKKLDSGKMKERSSSSSDEEEAPPSRRSNARPTRNSLDSGKRKKKRSGSSSDSDEEYVPSPRKSKARSTRNNLDSGKKKKCLGSSSDEAPKPASSRARAEPVRRETFEEFQQRIVNQRVTAGTLLTFKFLKKRCQMLTKEESYLPQSHGGILYWMSRDQRVQDNWALIKAQRLALQEKVPLLVCFCLVPKFLEATIRHYGFMLRGLKLVREELLELNIPFTILFGEAKTVLPDFVTEHDIGGIVTDFSPLRVPKRWVQEVVENLSETVPVCQVDAHNVVPVWVTSDKLEYSARTIRPRIHNNLHEYLTDFPAVIPHPHEAKSKFPDPFEKWDELIDFLEVNKSVDEVEWAKAGAEEGLKTLKTFLDVKLKDYGEQRNDPNKDVVSNLSPWLHFGQISAARCILEVSKSSHQDGKKSFIEETLVRRELSDNFCFYNENYDNFNGAPNWARKTLDDHRKDKRLPLFDLVKLEKAITYDDLWNAAQNQLKIEGKMHGFLRMYWAKKILEWTESPEKALEISIYLNDKYSLDGRDPNGFVGCMWSICGIHDQGWKERTVFGKIRFMNYDGCKRKFDVAAFVTKYNRLAKEAGVNLK